MANQEHLERLKGGVAAWNAWRVEAGHQEMLDLSGADLNGMDLRYADLHWVDLTAANLQRALLGHAHLAGSCLEAANLEKSVLPAADLFGANLCDVNFTEAELAYVLFVEAHATRADLTRARLRETIFVDIDLSTVVGLHTCVHSAPSTLDHRTLQKSSKLPLPFLRGIGLPDGLIQYLPSLFSQSIQQYSCFISYSTIDQDFADRLHSDLQNKGVRCWFAPHDMPIGGKILDEIDTAIRLRDKLLLILSEHSIASDWVEDEVTKAFEEERKRGQIVLFPIRLDDAVMDTDEAWAAKLRARHIGDFRRWKEHDAYKAAFERVLRDLTVKKDG